MMMMMMMIFEKNNNQIAWRLLLFGTYYHMVLSHRNKLVSASRDGKARQSLLHTCKYISSEIT